MEAEDCFVPYTELLPKYCQAEVSAQIVCVCSTGKAYEEQHGLAVLAVTHGAVQACQAHHSTDDRYSSSKNCTFK